MKIITDESGATSIEYGVIAGLVSIFILTALVNVGTQVDALYTSVASQISAALTAN